MALCLARQVVRERVERSEPIRIRVDGRGYFGDLVLMKLQGVEIERFSLLAQRPDDASTINQLEKARIQIDRDWTSCSGFAPVDTTDARPQTPAIFHRTKKQAQKKPEETVAPTTPSRCPGLLTWGKSRPSGSADTHVLRRGSRGYDGSERGL